MLTGDRCSSLKHYNLKILLPFCLIQKAGCCEEPVLPLQIPRTDLTWMDTAISVRSWENATRTGQAQSEKSFFAKCSLELHWIYHPTCEHLFANHFTEFVLGFAGEQSSESQHKLAPAKPLHAEELHPGNVSCAPAILPCSWPDPWCAGRECRGP